jgi:3',5'-cyclic AMP phosphodiesterase CpdA
MLRQAVATIAKLNPRPDCVLATGDLTDCGLPDEYEIVAEALAALPMPSFMIPGNHDRRDVMRACLGARHPYLRQDAHYLHYGSTPSFPDSTAGRCARNAKPGSNGRSRSNR